MTNIRVMNLPFLAVLAVVFTSCLGENVCGKDMVEQDDACVFPKDTETADLVTVAIQIPEDFDGEPELLAVSFFDNEEMSGVPAGFGEKTTDLDIESGSVLELTSSQAGLEGNYYMTIVLYCDGGGNGMGPVAGVDWVGTEIVSVTLGPGTGIVDAGEMSLVLYE